MAEKTRADTLGIHLIFRPRDRKEQVVLRDVDASKTLVILETGANYSSSSSPPHTLCVPIPAAVHDFPPTSTCSFHPSTPTSTPGRPPILLSFFLPVLSSLSLSLSVASLLKLLPRMTAHRIVIPFHTADLE